MCQNITPKRAGVSRDQVNNYFTNLETSLKDVPPSNIVNYDETNSTDDPCRKLCIFRRGSKYPERAMHHSKSSTSLMFAGSASGVLLPVYVVYKAENLCFTCLDIAKDSLPDADCVIIRQVLQHLSNQEVKQVLDKLHQYQYIILTEHIPIGEFIPNKDIISGQGIRLKKKSGLVVTETPFYFKAINQEELLKIELPNNKGCIKTILYTIF